MKNKMQERLDLMTRELGASVGMVLKRGGMEKAVGFALQVFTYGKDGLVSYTSSAQRSDMIRVLRECADVIENGAQSEIDRIIRARLQEFEDKLHEVQATPVFAVALRTEDGRNGLLEVVKCPEIENEGLIHLLEHCKFILKTPTKGVDASH
jgi:hypothetical protein